MTRENCHQIFAGKASARLVYETGPAPIDYCAQARTSSQARPTKPHQQCNQSARTFCTRHKWQSSKQDRGREGQVHNAFDDNGGHDFAKLQSRFSAKEKMHVPFSPRRKGRKVIEQISFTRGKKYIIDTSVCHATKFARPWHARTSTQRTKPSQLQEYDNLLCGLQSTWSEINKI